jgi:RNA polymerase sigma factor (sigma-70 family)
MPTGHANRLLPSLRRVVLVRQTAELSDGQLLAAFVGDKDGDAFAALVRRHGAMVLGVCRRVVGDTHTAEDAFQAVFVVLARRAACVRPREGVGNWLYGVAFRTAIKARSVLARRRSREKQVETMPDTPAPAPADVWSDLQPVIDDELSRLPVKLRLPVILCDLEGRPQREVAKHLGVPPATLATRLATARRTLAKRLGKRGVALSGGALAGVLSSQAAALAVSHRLADGVVRAAEAVAAGEGVAALVSAQAVQLSEGVMRIMLVTKLKAVGVAVLTALGLTTGVGVGLAPAFAAGDEPVKPAAQKPAGESDAAYLNRLCQDLRGTNATTVEKGYFAADRDGNKRRKVIDWLMTDETVKAWQAKKHGADENLNVTYSVLLDPLAVTADGHAELLSTLSQGLNSDAGVNGVALNERSFDLDLSVPKQYTVWTTDAVIGANTVYRRVRNQPVTTWYARLIEPQPPAEGTDRQWVELYHPQPLTAQPDLRTTKYWVFNAAAESDADFLKRVVKAARGTDPTALEQKYFADDKDAKKREKLLDSLLKEPGLAKKLGDDWKKKMLEHATTTAQARSVYEYQVVNRPLVLNYRQALTVKTAPQPDRLDKLLGHLIDAKKTDAQILDALTLAIVGRQPADGEKLAVAAVAKASDRKAAWGEVMKALSATAEAKKYAADLTKRSPAEKK